MRQILLFLFGVATLLVAAQTIDPYSPDSSAPKIIPGMSLVFNDEFNIDGKLNAAYWGYESGFVRNSELQWYQSANANCLDGRLLIEGRKANFPNPNYVSGSTDWRKSRATVNYTSSSVITRGKKSWLFGRFEIRARIDTSKGAWPAIWTLGNTKDWPSCGEIDIMEFYRINNIPTVLANFAWGTATAWQAKWDSYTRPLSQLLATDARWPQKYHVWRMDWTKESIKLYVDNEPYNVVLLSQTLNADGSNPFLQPHYLLLNLALGSGGGDPSKSVFPLNYEVDYVRVYQDTPTGMLENRSPNDVFSIFIKNKILKFNFKQTVDEHHISIYNVNGVCVMNKKNTGQHVEFDLSDCRLGVYFVQCKGNYNANDVFVLK